MISGLVSLYSPQYAKTIIFMLQSTEYRAGPYLRWYWRTANFSRVAKRRTLDPTHAAQLLLRAMKAGMTLQITSGFLLVAGGLIGAIAGGLQLGAALLISYPVVWAHLVLLPLVAGHLFIRKPKESRAVKRSKSIFKDHKATIIAVAGSYGKTTMKELLATVLGEGKKVAMTPGNKNVSISHAYFAKRLKGDEDVLIIEYGEGAPGDVRRYAEITQPNIGVITGVAAAHLDRYKTVARAAKDIFSLAIYLGDKPVYVNAESPEAKALITKSMQGYSVKGVKGWKLSKVETAIDHTAFIMKKGKNVLRLRSGLIGMHQVGPLAAAAAIAHDLGLSAKHIEAGVAKTIPYEHRLQPYRLHGAWIIDDTYNGNIEGVRVGTELLAHLPAKRKIYVSPGLVEQGKQTRPVHIRMGELIAKAKPDIVVLMKNSVTKWIVTGLETGKYQGEVQIQENPLRFYTNLNQFVASGDVVLMQNDWTDNYN